jgi:hypothetical protein
VRDKVNSYEDFVRIITVALVFVLVCMVASNASAQAPSASGASAHAQPMTHEAFMAIETGKRSHVFAKSTAENKPALKRAHGMVELFDDCVVGDVG